ncbi:MAG: FAD-dependent oxidoreductase [Oscillospiraceae bacterium]|nr:FAD-dependent oxidoreductase [Oscillospiraceae bacterium]
MVGAGTSGALCAVAAARCGLKTILLERTGMVGGVASTTLMGSFANLMVNTRLVPMTGGVIRELIDRMVCAGGMPYQSANEAVSGKIGKPFTIPFQPALYENVLIEMLEEAGVQLLLNCALVSGETLASGKKQLDLAAGIQRLRVYAEVVVDATGNAEAAASFGAETSQFHNVTYGCLMRIGSVTIDKTLRYIRERTPWKADPVFDEWFRKQEVFSDSSLRGLKHLLDPVCYDHAPMRDQEDKAMNDSKWAYIEERYQAEHVIYTLELSLFRDLIRQAVENDDFSLAQKTGEDQGVTFNGDGIAYGAWGDGIALCNIAKPFGFDASDVEKTTQAALLAKKYNWMVFRFLKKYVPGFENSYLLDMGSQTVSRTSRMIVGCDDPAVQQEYPVFAEPIYLFGGLHGHQTGCPVPYGKIVPGDLTNVFAVGKGSSHGNMYRGQISCMSMGVAAAAAAKVICRDHCNSKTIPADSLRAQLLSMGVILGTAR